MFLSLGDTATDRCQLYRKLIYAANWGSALMRCHRTGFNQIAWWDAVDYIGVDAFFPLMQVQADATVDDLERVLGPGRRACA